MLSAQSQEARDLLSAIDGLTAADYRRVLGDPIVRVAIDRAVSFVKMNGDPYPESDLKSILRHALMSLDKEPGAPPLAEAVTVPLTLYAGRRWPWIWSEERVSDDPLGSVFRRLMDQQHSGLVLATPDQHAREMLAAGASLLDDLCPSLIDSAMSHVHLIVVVGANSPTRITSLTNPRIPGVFFLSPTVLADPWQAAEYLLHEALHVKFLDLENTHSLFSSDYDEVNSPRIRPHWNKVQAGGASEWPINRVLTVLQVYVCLALFFTITAARSSSLEVKYGPTYRNSAQQARSSLDRAHYLADQLNQHQEYLGFAGQLYVRWLESILGVLDPDQPLRGSYVHLLLDLYERQADEVRALVSGWVDQASPAGGNLDQQLRKIAREEIGMALALFSMTPRVDPAVADLRAQEKALRDLDASGGDASASGDRFLAVRTSILQSLRDLDPRFYMRPCPGRPGANLTVPGELVRAMVEDSSRQLDDLLKKASR